jgi:N6-L-threonylcarbamoyladenine synthase
MKILAIETSCDETAVCVLEATGALPKARFKILGNALFSQAHLHEKYGGVYPSVAKREHGANLIPLLRTVLGEANLENKARDTEHADFKDEEREEIGKMLTHSPELFEQFIEYIPTIRRPDIDAIAFTRGPGLEPALWVGINFAEALSRIWNITLIPTNHMEGHVISSLVENKERNVYTMSKFEFPALALLLSGAHTEFDLLEEWTVYKTLGTTKDDAIGEAFDKVARMLNLPYPGGPEISKMAKEYSGEITLKLPRPMMKADNLDFSFSGLKTAVLYALRDNPDLVEKNKAMVARAFEDAVVEVVCTKTKRALEEYLPRTFVIGGGVSANERIRVALGELVQNEFPDIQFRVPPLELTTDNAVMIGMAGYVRHKTGTIANEKSASGRLSIAQEQK